MSDDEDDYYSDESKTEDYALWDFFGRRFGQDWLSWSTDGTVESVIRTYAMEEPREAVELTCRAIEHLIALGMDEPALDQYMFYKLKCAKDPAPLTYSEWLPRLLVQLREYLAMRP